MRVALVNPRWTFEGSIYFGCKEPHLPLEHGYARALLQAEGHDVELVDAHLHDLDLAQVRERLERFAPELLVVTTAPSYLFWRCAPPELRVPLQLLRAVADVARYVVAVGPHASTTPHATLQKLGVDAVVRGECEEVLATLARTERSAWRKVPSVTTKEAPDASVGPNAAADMQRAPVLHWAREDVLRHEHHHHRFDQPPRGPGAELEATRGCPYSCTFCAKDNFRNKFRKRPVAKVVAELDGLLAAGAEYVYFVDEIFMPDAELLAALTRRDVAFGVQLRIDLWNEAQLEALGKAGCVSIEAGVESITPEGRIYLAKRCKLSTEELRVRLVHAKRHVPFVQANLLDGQTDDAEAVHAWVEGLKAEGVWANEPVPLYPYPGSPEYTRRWGAPDDQAWERAHEHYLGLGDFSDIQEQAPRPLAWLEQV